MKCLQKLQYSVNERFFKLMANIIICIPFYENMKGIPPRHGDLFKFVLIISFTIILDVIASCRKYTDVPYLNLVSIVVNLSVSSPVNTELNCSFNTSAR